MFGYEPTVYMPKVRPLAHQGSSEYLEFSADHLKERIQGNLPGEILALEHLVLRFKRKYG